MRITIIVKLLSILLPFTFARSWTTKDECPTKIETRVSGDPCQYASAGYPCTAKPEFDTMDAVHTALSNCPNITSLDLRIVQSGCDADSGPERYNFPFDRLGGDKYPNLTSLKLQGYDFERPKHVDGARNEDFLTTWLRKVMATIKPRRPEQIVLDPANDKTHLDRWLDAMNWSCVKEFKIDNWDMTDEVLAKLPSHLTSLRKLETSNTSFITALPNNTLTHLTFVGSSTPTDLPAILAHQGATLESLEFRRPEQADEPFLADFDTSILPRMAHNLTHLAINIPRNGTWPLETLQTIASMLQLESADLYMNIASECAQQRPDRYTIAWLEGDWDTLCLGEEQLQKPFVSREGAEEMFAYMRRMKEGMSLKNVTFWAGDWARASEEPLYAPEWLEGKRAKVVCSSDMHGGEENGWCKVDFGEDYWMDEWFW